MSPSMTQRTRPSSANQHKRLIPWIKTQSQSLSTGPNREDCKADRLKYAEDYNVVIARNVENQHHKEVDDDRETQHPPQRGSHQSFPGFFLRIRYCTGQSQDPHASFLPAVARQLCCAGNITQVNSFLPSNALPTPFGEALLAPGEPGLVPHSRRIFSPVHSTNSHERRGCSLVERAAGHS